MKQDYLIELEGKPAGRFFSFSGGSAEADVVTTMGGNHVQQKHISNVRYQDIVMKCGTGMSQTFYNWIGRSFGGSAERMNGAIVKLDGNQNVAGRLEFRDAIVKELTIPELKSGSNDAAYLLVSISPEFTRTKTAGGKAELGVYVSEQSGKWTVGGFNVSIDGMHPDTAHISRIASMTLGRKMAEDQTGSARTHGKIPAKTEYPNLTFYIPEMHADKFFQWFEDFVTNGNNLDRNEKAGVIDFFGPTGGKPFFSLECKNLGIFALHTETPLRSKTMAPVRISLYTESMTFSAGTAAIK